MNWLYYLLEANLYLILFYGFYKLVLHKETFYTLNRCYLIATSLIAFMLPFFQFGFLKASKITEISLVAVQDIDQENLPVGQSEIQIQESMFTVQYVILSVYILVVLFFVIKLGLSLFRILSMRKHLLTVLENGIKIIELSESKVAFSFFNLLFLNPQLSEKKTIIKHELVHIKQKHSIDVILFELIQIMNWFNPITYFIKKDAKLIHEYLADEETTRSDTEKYDYAIFLIKNSSGIQNLSLTNQMFNSSILKSRINMLNQKKSARWARLKLLMGLPILAAMLCISTLAFTKDYGIVDLYSGTKDISIKQDTVKSSLELNDGIHIPDKNSLYIALKYDKTNKKLTPYTKKVILINGEEKEPGTYSGATQLNYIIVLDAENATKKYGEKGKYGVIEAISSAPVILPIPPVQKLSGNANTIFLPLPPPIQDTPAAKNRIPKPKVDQIKFPPPIVKPDAQDHFYSRNLYSEKTHAAVRVDKRYIVINGKPVADNSTFSGVSNTSSVIFLSQKEAVKAYGDKGKNGAVVITGKDVKFLTLSPPPPPKVDVQRYPPAKSNP